MNVWCGGRRIKNTPNTVISSSYNNSIDFFQNEVAVIGFDWYRVVVIQIFETRQEKNDHIFFATAGIKII